MDVDGAYGALDAEHLPERVLVAMGHLEIVPGLPVRGVRGWVHLMRDKWYVVVVGGKWPSGKWQVPVGGTGRRVHLLGSVHVDRPCAIDLAELALEVGIPSGWGPGVGVRG